MYSAFRISQFTTGGGTSFFLFMVMYTLIFIFRYARVLLYPGDHHVGLLFKFTILFGITFSFIPGWITIYCIYVKADVDVLIQECIRILRIKNLTIFTQISYVDFTILSFTTFWSLLLIARSSSGPCPELDVSYYTVDNTSYCNPGYSHGMLPQDTVLALVLGVSSSQALLKGSCWAVILVAWVIQLSAVVTCFIQLKSFNSSIVPHILVCQLLFLYAHENQLLLYYMGLLHQKSLLLDSLAKNNQKMAAEEHTKEIQYLIANTAHDLKTPLQVLDMGADDIRKRLESLPLTLARLSQSMLIGQNVKDKDLHNVAFALPGDERAAILETTGTITSTIVFMSMTINRVLDFSKVSHNIKLVPAYETISLTAVMAWPASILRSLEGRVSIIIDPVPTNICQHVITDKGWLTENLLCLFSNAIKYSSVGFVNVRCYLVEDKLKLKLASNNITKTNDTNYKNYAENTTSATCICVEVEDNGIGIPQESRARLFSPFQQAQRMTTGGTGLGLYSLRKRIEALGGTCGIKSRHDKREGSCFWFTFPYRPDFDTLSEGTMTPNSGSRTASISRRGSMEGLDCMMKNSIDECEERDDENDNEGDIEDGKEGGVIGGNLTGNCVSNCVSNFRSRTTSEALKFDSINADKEIGINLSVRSHSADKFDTVCITDDSSGIVVQNRANCKSSKNQNHREIDISLGADCRTEIDENCGEVSTCCSSPDSHSAIITKNILGNIPRDQNILENIPRVSADNITRIVSMNDLSKSVCCRGNNPSSQILRNPSYTSDSGIEVCTIELDQRNSNFNGNNLLENNGNGNNLNGNGTPNCGCSAGTSILLVDDSMAILKMCSRSLTREVRALVHFCFTSIFSLKFIFLLAFTFD